MCWRVNKPDRLSLGLSSFDPRPFGSVQDEVAVEDVCKQIIKQWTDYISQSKAKKDGDDGIKLLLVFTLVRKKKKKIYAHYIVDTITETLIYIAKVTSSAVSLYSLSP